MGLAFQIRVLADAQPSDGLGGLVSLRKFKSPTKNIRYTELFAFDVVPHPLLRWASSFGRVVKVFLMIGVLRHSIVVLSVTSRYIFPQASSVCGSCHNNLI